MRLIKLSNSCYIAADEISEIHVNPDAYVITVRTKKGIGYTVEVNNNESIYVIADRLANEINSCK